MGQAHNGILLSNRKERHTTTRINLSNITEVKKSRSEARLLHEKLPDDKSIKTERRLVVAFAWGLKQCPKDTKDLVGGWGGGWEMFKIGLL